MVHEFRFPDVGEGIVEGEIVAWKVKVGDRVEAHQVLLEMETDKAVVEIPSPFAGTVHSLTGEPGDVIRVGEVIAAIDDSVEAVPEPSPPRAALRADLDVPLPGAHRRPEASAKGSPVRRGSVGVVGELEEAPDEEEERSAEAAESPTPLSVPRVEALPKDRLLAKQLGVDLSGVRGTGPGGRITEADLRSYAARGVPEHGRGAPVGVLGRDDYGPVERLPLRGVRRKIAEAMVRSLSRAAQVTTVDEADVTLLSHIRRKEKEAAGEQGVKLTFLPFVIKALVGALKREPFLNASLDEGAGEIVVKGYFHVGVAVETRDGLLVPVIRDADQKSILTLAREIQDLAQRARKRALGLQELKGGTFTVTNYGAIGGLFATPILNDPEVGILGTGKILEKPVAEAGAIKVRQVMPLSLTFDHRVVDGATAQHFLNGVIRHLEDPDLLLIGG
ncbi:MAG: 2-oxo acid dehydrogenase subunit E2 [Deltaproteobacteria bacterium]|nr:2-oxo acid dehydrogenase subunit E2 [Deltaproteobacteria bacterium]